MSTGKVSQCRSYLIEAGLLIGNLRRDPGYPQPVWHIRIPDLWAANVEWCLTHPKISERIAFKKELSCGEGSKELSCGEGGISPHEGGTPPHETKKNKEEQKEQHNTFAKLSSEKNGLDQSNRLYEWSGGLAETQYAEPEYISPGEEFGENPKGRPKWMIPDTDFQVEILGICGRKYFEKGQKARLKSIEKAMDGARLLSSFQKGEARYHPDYVDEMISWAKKSNRKGTKIKIAGLLTALENDDNWHRWLENSQRKDRSNGEYTAAQYTESPYTSHQ
jgi:hypothetical protein